MMGYSDVVRHVAMTLMFMALTLVAVAQFAN
jgi:hypothetical protein